MTSRELVVKTLNHEPVPRVPRDLWIPEGDDSARAEELAEIKVRFPGDIVRVEAAPLHGKSGRGKAGKTDDYTDAWDCVWRGGQQATPAEPKRSPLSESGKIASYQPPTGLLDRSRFSRVNRRCSATDRFVLAWSDVAPFNRLRYLRGSEAALMDLARGTKETRDLVAMLHDLACKEIELWAGTDVDGVVFHDDWGTPEGLLIAPEMWRELFRPWYREYCKILHAKDKFVFFCSDGNIQDIFSDLIKAGVDAVHAQMHLMKPERLAKRYRGRLTFWGGMDGQRLHNPGTVEEYRHEVLTLRKALDFGGGGVIAQCQWDPGVPIQTVATFFELWLIPLAMHA